MPDRIVKERIKIAEENRKANIPPPKPNKTMDQAFNKLSNKAKLAIFRRALKVCQMGGGQVSFRNENEVRDLHHEIVKQTGLEFEVKT